MKASRSHVAIAALVATANARNLALPNPTASFELPLDGISPRPTKAPVGLHELFRRASESSTTDETVLVAPDNTCGYISGRPGAGYTCFGDATCVFFTSATDRDGAVACCNTAECNLRLTCIDYTEFFSSSACDGGCEVDAYTLKCTETSAPYCNTIAFEDGGITDFWCNNVDITSAQQATTTYRGETDDRSFAPLVLSDTSSSAIFSLTSGSIGPGASVTSDTTSDTTSASASSTTSAGGDSDDSDDSKTPVGPIVGGVVGGVGALGLAGLAIFFFLRNKKKKQVAAAGTTANNNTVPPPYQQPPMQQQPGTGPGGYNPVPQNQQQTYYDPKNPYPSPQAGYVQPNNGAGGFYPVQDPNNPSSPTGTTVTDPRMSQAPISPSPSYAGYNVPGQQTPAQNQPGFQPQQAVIHEAPTTEHKDQMHELA
ncbi:Fc.00g017390.m01.CDS01 [Cosmosporella sp. VM-42]